MLKDELVAISEGVLASHWDATKRELSEMMRALAAKGVSFIAVGTTTQEAENALVEWAAEQQLAMKEFSHFTQRGRLLSWGYVPAGIDGPDVSISPDGSLKRVKLSSEPLLGAGEVSGLPAGR